MSREVWLLRIDGCGAPLLCASEVVAPVDRDGKVWAHRAGLEQVETVERVDLGSDDIAGETSARCVARLTPSPSDLLLAGWRLDGAQAELALWTVGRAYESREIVYRGTVAPDGAPEADRALALSLLPPALDVGDVWPPTDAVIDTESWPNHAANARDAVIPWVFGAPGSFADTTGTDRTTSASPCYVVDTTAAAQVGLICGAPVMASTVTIYSAPEEASASFSPAISSDGRGRLVATVDLSSKDGVWTLDDTAELYVIDWDAGGVRSDCGPGVMSGAGDVLLYLLRRQGLPLDDHAFLAARRRLDRVKVAGQWRESAVPWEWLRTHWAPLLPDVWLLAGPRGLRPVYLDERAPALAPAVTVGRDVYRPDGGAPEMDGLASDGLTRAVVAYALRVRTDAMQARVALGPHRRRGEYLMSGETTYAQRAASRGSVNESDLDAVAVYDRSEAYAACGRALREWWAPPVLDEFWAPLSARNRYPLGGMLRLTDDAHDYADRPVLIVGRSLRQDRVVLVVAHQR